MDLEVWLVGMPREVDAALSALAEAGAIAGASKPEPLYGSDSGRVRRYLRVRIPLTASKQRQETGRHTRRPAPS